MYISGEVRLGLGILAKVKQNRQVNKNKEREAKEKVSIEYVNLVRKGGLIKQEIIRVNQAPKDLKILQLKLLLKALKYVDNKVTPTIKANIVECFDQWSELYYLHPSQNLLI